MPEIKNIEKIFSQTMAVTTKAELRKDLYYSTIISLEYIIEDFTKVLQRSECSCKLQNFTNRWRKYKSLKYCTLKHESWQIHSFTDEIVATLRMESSTRWGDNKIANKKNWGVKRTLRDTFNNSTNKLCNVVWWLSIAKIFSHVSPICKILPL